MRVVLFILGAWALLTMAVVIWWGKRCEVLRQAYPEHKARSFAEELEANNRGYRPFQEDPRFEGDKIIYRS